jgi:hypothetical protein
MKYLLIFGPTGFTEGYSQIEPLWFDDLDLANQVLNQINQAITSNSNDSDDLEMEWTMEIVQVSMPSLDVNGGWWVVWDQLEGKCRGCAVPATQLMNAADEWLVLPCSWLHDWLWALEEVAEIHERLLDGHSCHVNGLDSSRYFWPIPPVTCKDCAQVLKWSFGQS